MSSFDLNDKVWTVIVTVLICFIGVMIYGAIEQGKECKAAGGIMSRGVCFSRDSVIDLDPPPEIAEWAE